MLPYLGLKRHGKVGISMEDVQLDQIHFMVWYYFLVIDVRFWS